MKVFSGFGTIRNNTALKLCFLALQKLLRFWNHSKQHSSKTYTDGELKYKLGFGTIRNNTALKPRRKIFLTKFRNRAIRPSQTSARQVPIVTLIIPYFQGSRNSLDPIHTAENHRFSEAQQTRRTVD